MSSILKKFIKKTTSKERIQAYVVILECGHAMITKRNDSKYTCYKCFRDSKNPVDSVGGVSYTSSTNKETV